MSAVRARHRPPASTGETQGVVAQSVRVPACHAGGRGFEPRQPRQEKRVPPGTLFSWRTRSWVRTREWTGHPVAEALQGRAGAGADRPADPSPQGAGAAFEPPLKRIPCRTQNGWGWRGSNPPRPRVRGRDPASRSDGAPVGAPWRPSSGRPERIGPRAQPARSSSPRRLPRRRAVRATSLSFPGRTVRLEGLEQP